MRLLAVGFLRARPFALVLLVSLAAPAESATLAHFDRGSLEATLGSFQVEDYAGVPNLALGTLLDRVLGPGVPIHRSTGGGVQNQVFLEIYNATNTSFRITFTNTEFGTSDGVFGVGFDYSQSIDDWNAFVTFGDGSTQEFDLAVSAYPTFEFFGITSNLLIRDVHVSLPGGEAGEADAAFFLDNLTWGMVPEPGGLGLVGLGLTLLGWWRSPGRNGRPIGSFVRLSSTTNRWGCGQT